MSTHDRPHSWRVLRGPVTVWCNHWLNIESVELELPSGIATEFFRLRSGDGVAILVEDSEGRVLLNRQYRPAVEEVVLEVPGGGIEAGETPAEAAAREAREESGVVVGNLVLLGCLYRNPARDSGRISVYWGSCDGFVRPDQEKYEFLSPTWVDLIEAERMMSDGVPTDPATAFAISSRLLLRERGQASFDSTPS